MAKQEDKYVRSKYGSMGVWEYGSMGVWEYGSMGALHTRKRNLGSVEVWKCGSVEVWAHFEIHFQPTHFTCKSETKFKGQKKLRKLQQGFEQRKKLFSGNHPRTQRFQMGCIDLTIDQFNTFCF